ncbi:MAG: hypothetical protein GXY38_05205 [Planctomycetes bacterium]|nr:hypothetical protein [Planctomycetota bacterium]
MGCVLVILALLLPRVVMFFIWLLTDWFGRAFGSWLIPLLGFLFLPYATLAYMAAVLNSGGLHGWWIVLFIIAIVVDVSHWGSTKSLRRLRPGRA